MLIILGTLQNGLQNELVRWVSRGTSKRIEQWFSLLYVLMLRHLHIHTLLTTHRFPLDQEPYSS